MAKFLKGIFGGKDEEGLEEGWDVDMNGNEPGSIAQGTLDEPILLGDEAMKKAEQAPQGTDAAPSSARAPQEARAFDIQAVWQVRNVTPQEQQRVAKAQHLLAALPSGIPDDAKRQIVEASLKAFEVSIEEIVAGAAHEIEALKVFIGTTNSQADDFAAGSRKRIVQLEAEIEGIRQTMQAASVEKERLVGSANEVIDQVTPILDFFEPAKGPIPTPAPEAKPQVAHAPARAPSIPPRTGT